MCDSVSEEKVRKFVCVLSRQHSPKPKVGVAMRDPSRRKSHFRKENKRAVKKIGIKGEGKTEALSSTSPSPLV